MKRPENREIDGKNYVIYHMGPKQQIRTLKFIAKTVGKPLGVLSSDDSSSGILDMNTKVLGDFITSALESVDDDGIIDQIEKLLDFCERKNPETGNMVKVTMEKDFHGELPHLFKVAGVILEVNFGSFLGVSTDLVEKLKGRLMTKSN